MRFSPSEFIVEEVTPSGALLEAGKQLDLGKAGDQGLEKDFFSHFVLEKTNWNSSQAVKEIARRLRINAKRFNFAGTKDRSARTTQLVSAFAVKPEDLLKVRLKDVSINGAWKARGKIKLGELSGNRFTIILTNENMGKPVSRQLVEQNYSRLNGLVPNFFGSQRFGSLRANSHVVGKFLLQKKFLDAAQNFLCATDEGEGSGGFEARTKLAGIWGQENCFKLALDFFPQHLKYERTVLGHLSQFPTDYIGALRKLPRVLQLMFVHAYQSFLFNQVLLKKIGESDFNEGEEANLVGYESAPTALEEELLSADGLSKDDFLLKSLPELSSKGSRRKLFVKLNGFQILQDEPLTIRFSLPPGAYATVAVEELVK
ncbi:tRNA pseudouridine(13) synthase TruD [Candidatus Micrarchaeota archaeon]|nr:tRNA pseudouridine(13) synthase TruD [Candidatus Micrarchaeota archaeon]